MEERGFPKGQVRVKFVPKKNTVTDDLDKGIGKAVSGYKSKNKV